MSRYATSPDGVTWTWHGVALVPRPGHRDTRGVRINEAHELRTELLLAGGE